MSGGAYEYLCWALDLSDLIGKRYHLTDMADALARLGYAPDAARETQALIADIRAAETRADTAIKRLAPVWKAVEWWHSSDCSEDEVHDALTTYRGGVPAQRKSYLLTPEESAAVDAMRAIDATTEGETDE